MLDNNNPNSFFYSVTPGDGTSTSALAGMAMAQNPGDKVPLKRLYELAQKENSELQKLKKLGTVQRDVQESSPPQIQAEYQDDDKKTWTVVLDFTSWKLPSTITGVGTDSNKQNAKHQAAQEILNQYQKQIEDARKSSTSTLPHSGSRSSSEGYAGSPPSHSRSSGSSDSTIPDTEPESVRIRDHDTNARVVKDAIGYFPDRIIATGGMGTVYVGYHERKDKPAAVKLLPKGARPKNLQLEIDILMKLRNKENVVTYFQCEEDSEERLFIAMELAVCDLEGYLAEERPFKELKKLVQDAAKGLRTLHREKVIHRDLKPKNILIFGQGDNVHAKIADFGISRQYKDINVGGTTRMAGSDKWMAPELEGLQTGARTGSGSRSKSSNVEVKYHGDIYALGLVAFYTLSKGHKHPFYDENEDDDYNASPEEAGSKPDWDLLLCNTSEEALPLIHLLKAMLSEEPQKRPMINVILEHPFFWTGEQFLKFTERFSNAAKAQGTLRQRLHDEYDMFSVANLKSHTNWKVRLSPEFKNYLRKSREKTYDGSDIIHLVECIRDKDQHRVEWKNSKTNPNFGENAEAYGEYFKNMFPELGTFLFTHLQDENISEIKQFFEHTQDKEVGKVRFEKLL